MKHLAWIMITWLGFLCITSADAQESIDSEKHYEWPTIRGKHWDGRSEEVGLAETWPEQGPPMLWTRELGQGYSSFVAWDLSIATQYQTLGGQYVVCMDANSGKVQWQYRYAWPYEPAGVYPGPRSTPCYFDGCIYFTGPSGLVGCLNSSTGDLIWSLELYEHFQATAPGFGYACSPVVVDELLYLPVGGVGSSMIALDRRSGKTVWKSGDDAASYASVLPIRFQESDLVLGYLQNALVCHDAKTGARKWRRALSSGYDEHSAWPLYQEPYLWISGPFQNGSELLELTTDPTQPIKMVRRDKLMSNDIFSSVLHDGSIYGFDLHEAQAKTHRTSRGIFRCIDFHTGQVNWSVGTGRLDRGSEKKQKQVEPSIGHSTVLIADGKLILMNDLGELILARAAKAKYEELARVPVLSGEMCWTQPCLANGRLFVRNHSRVACLLLSDPASIDSTTLAVTRTVHEIPQSAYRDWAGTILSIEPEYLFDLPSLEQFLTWFMVCMAILLGAAIVVVAPWMLVVPKRKSETTYRKSQLVMAGIFWSFCYLLGALGTTWLSHGFDKFIFTWPICLYVAWHLAIGHLELHRRELTWHKRFRGMLAGAIWLINCVIYFLICRRLSLLFEWTFLGGFLAALPFNLMSTHCFTQRRWRLVWQAVMAVVAFSAFFWSSVGLLMLRQALRI